MTPDPDLSAVKTSTPVNIPAVEVTIIGAGAGAGTSSGAPIPSGTMLATADHQPNVIVNVVTPLVAIGVRFGNSFCVSLAGSLAAGGLTEKLIPHVDFTTLVQGSVMLAACIAGVGLLKDLATVFSGLEKKFPLASGSV